MNGKPLFYFIILLGSIIALCNCRKAYQPAVLTAGNNYLVVDGFINVQANDSTTIFLTRAQNLLDTVVVPPETGASIIIEDKSGNTYQLSERADGRYVTAALHLNPAGEYRLNVQTKDGKKYQSAYVKPVVTPPIDSVSWVQNDGVQISVNTHDPANQTHYYRWQYVETYEYHSTYSSPYVLENGLILLRDSTDQADICYQTKYSADVLIGTSAALSQDIISRHSLKSIPANDPILSWRYSILVTQFAISPDAYQYWQVIARNSTGLGTLFDLQPSQIYGNIVCTSNPSEPVIGFVSATTAQRERIFIKYRDLQNWNSIDTTYGCELHFIPQDPADYRIWSFPDTSYVPVYFISNGTTAIARRKCVDCTWYGGTNKKPSFW